MTFPQNTNSILEENATRGRCSHPRQASILEFPGLGGNRWEEGTTSPGPHSLASYIWKSELLTSQHRQERCPLGSILTLNVMQKPISSGWRVRARFVSPPWLEQSTDCRYLSTDGRREHQARAQPTPNLRWMGLAPHRRENEDGVEADYGWRLQQTGHQTDRP